MFGVGISLPKQLMSLKPISSASMIMMLGLLLLLMIVLEEENCYGGGEWSIEVRRVCM